MRIAAQLYTVRNELAADFTGTLRRVRDAGYEHVELAGCGQYGAAELKRVLTDCGLTPCSGHCPMERLESDLRGAIEDTRALGMRYLVCPYIPEPRRRDEAGWRACAALLDKAGEVCRKNDIQLCYHNHSFEFIQLDGRTALDLLYAETDSANLQAELDTYWIRHAGGDPAEWIEKLAGRCPLLHLKDMAADAQCSFAPVGAGILDWPRIFAAAQRAGVEWAIVEQDICTGDPVESLRASRDHLKARPSLFVL